MKINIIKRVKNLFFALALILPTIFVVAPAGAVATPFITTWKTDNEGVTAPNQIAIPVNPAESYDYTVSWGDGSSDSNVNGSIVHTYASPGTYTVKISGQFPRIYFADGGDRAKILSVVQWGSIAWSSGEAAFKGATNLVINARDAPDLTRVKSLTYMFQNAKSLTGGVENWNVAGVEGFGYMFAGATNFNANISGWNMSSAVNTEYMFSQASSFNQNISGWNASRLGNAKGMFFGASSFNQSLNNWNLSRVFNVEDMFRNAAAYDQSISKWNIGNITYISRLLNGSTLSTSAYDQMLDTWATNQTASNVVFDAGRSMYCTSASARDHLINKLGWKITDGGADNVFCGGVDVSFVSLPALKENQAAGSLVGKLSVNSSLGSNFDISICPNNPSDSRFFELNNSNLYTKRSFDYETPLDENKDNYYEVCIKITSASTGASIQKYVLVGVGDTADTDQQAGGVGSGNGGTGQVLGTSTAEASTKPSASNSTGKVLGATGVAVGLAGIYYGLSLTSFGLVLKRRPRRHKRYE
jgi:hypothetical protein